MAGAVPSGLDLRLAVAAPLRLALALAPGTAPTLAAALVLRNLGAEPEDPLRIERSELTGARAREAVALAGPTAGPFQPNRTPAASLPRLPAGKIPKVAQIRLQDTTQRRTAATATWTSW